MKAKLFQHHISVRPSPVGGYGVYADKVIRKGEIVEECYALSAKCFQSELIHYAFKGDDHSEILPLGYGSIYNHSPMPNLNYSYSPDQQILIFKAKRNIAKGEELFIYYGNEWFADRYIQVNVLSKLRQRFYFYKPLLLRLALILSACVLLVKLANQLAI